MDPLLFGIKADVVGEALGAVVLLSIIVERALSPLFEWKVIFDKITGKSLKEPIAFLVSVGVVYFYKFDALAVIFSQEKNSFVGYLITAAVVAGGSKGSIALFRDYLGWKSSTQKEHDEAKKEEKERKKQASASAPAAQKP